MKRQSNMTRQPGRRRSFLSAPSALCLLLLALALPLVGCGGGSAPESSVAHLGSAGSTEGGEKTSDPSQGADPLAFSKCMRAHGVRDFPDPNSEGSIQLNAKPGDELDPNSPTFQKAMKACQSLAPPANGAPSQEDQDEALEFSKCMRANGVTNFPDPQTGNPSATGPSTTKGEGSGEPGGPSFDPESATFEKALKACEKYASGGMTFQSAGPTG